MIKIERILFPTDFSANAKHALKIRPGFCHGTRGETLRPARNSKLNIPIGTGGMTYPVSKNIRRHGTGSKRTSIT